MEIKGLTINCFYMPVEMTYSFVLHVSVDDKPKMVFQVPVAEQLLYKDGYGVDAQYTIVHRFDLLLAQNNFDKDTRTAILTWVAERLKKISAPPDSGYSSGTHNEWGYSPGTEMQYKQPKEQPKINGKPINKLASNLPGVNTIVKYPCNCHPISSAELFGVIVHLNDYAGWSRERIADWIDRLHDKGIINAEFQPWDETGLAEEEKQFADANVELVGNATKAIKDIQAFGKTAEKIKETFEKIKEKE